MVDPKPNAYIPPRSEQVHERRRSSGTLRVRAEQRTELFVELAFTSVAGSGVGYAKNISLGGMYVETMDPVPFNATVTLHMPLPGFPDLVDLSAVVRWSDETGMGLQFGTMGARVTHALTELVKS